MSQRLSDLEEFSCPPLREDANMADKPDFSAEAVQGLIDRLVRWYVQTGLSLAEEAACALQDQQAEIARLRYALEVAKEFADDDEAMLAYNACNEALTA